MPSRKVTYDEVALHFDKAIDDAAGENSLLVGESGRLLPGGVGGVLITALTPIVSHAFRSSWCVHNGREAHL